MRQGRWGKRVAPGEGVGGEVLFGVEDLLPGDALAGVGGFAPEDPDEGGEHHAGAVVDGGAAADGGEEGVMFEVVHVFLLTPEAPAFGAVNEGGAAFADGEGAFVAVDEVSGFVVAAFDLAGAEVADEAFAPVEGGVEVVEDIAADGGDLSTAGGDAGFRRGIAHGPADFVNGVDGLFDNAISGGPGVVVPVAKLPFDVAHAGGASGFFGHGFDGAGEVGGEHATDLADVAVTQFLEGFDA